MTEPQTAAGRQLLADASADDCYPPCRSLGQATPPLVEVIAAIETEAREQGRIAGIEQAEAAVNRVFARAAGGFR